jgi:hypothetical protein
LPGEKAKREESEKGKSEGKVYKLFLAIAKSFFCLIALIVGAQRAVPSKPYGARLAVPLQNKITFGNVYKTRFFLSS